MNDSAPEDYGIRQRAVQLSGFKLQLLIVMLLAVALYSGDGNSTDFRLIQYPDPLSSTIICSFALTESATVDLMVFDISGKIINRLVDGRRSEGQYTVRYKLTARSGIYFVKLQTDSSSVVKKFVLIR